MAEDWKSDVGWAGFYNSAHTDFSPSFKQQFSIQLKDAFNALTGIEDFTEKKDFLILVGMSDMKIMYQDGYGFGLLELITPSSISIYQTFFWKTEQPVDAFRADDYTEENIEFGFCADFDKNSFLKYYYDDIITSIQDTTLGFRYTANFELFPDLTFSFKFKEGQVEGDEIKEIEQLMDKKFINAHVSKLSRKDDTYLCMVDFQGESDEEALFQIGELITHLASNLIGKSISSIGIT